MFKYVSAAAIAAALVVAPSSANDVADHCTAFAESLDISPEPCSCVGEVADSNQDVADAILSLATREDLEAMDPAVFEAIQACLPAE